MTSPSREFSYFILPISNLFYLHRLIYYDKSSLLLGFTLGGKVIRIFLREILFMLFPDRYRPSENNEVVDVP